MPDRDPALTGAPSTDPDRTKKSDYDAQLKSAEVAVVEEAEEAQPVEDDHSEGDSSPDPEPEPTPEHDEPTLNEEN